MIELHLSKNGDDDRVLVVEDRPYVDTVYKIAKIRLRDSDTLTISYDLVISSYTNHIKTGEIKERFEYTVECEARRMSIRFIRFTKLDDVAQIRVYSRMPSDVVRPDKGLAATRTG